VYVPYSVADKVEGIVVTFRLLMWSETRALPVQDDM
jgi:hypothetical protein